MWRLDAIPAALSSQLQGSAYLTEILCQQIANIGSPSILFAISDTVILQRQIMNKANLYTWEGCAGKTLENFQIF